MLWERAAQAATATTDYAAAIQYAGRAHDYYLQRRQTRAAARAQAITGRVLRIWGRHAEARERLTAAVEVLRAEPDTDTVRALDELATLEVFAGSPDANRLTVEALILGQALDVGTGQLADLFVTRAIYLCMAERRPEGVAYFREGARLATQADDNIMVGRALLNLSDALANTDPAAAAEAARTAAGHLRRAGIRDYLAVAIHNLVQVLLMLGEWDAAEAELTQAMGSGELADDEFLARDRAWLAALRGDAVTAGATLADLRDLLTTEDLQDKSLISMAEAFTAAARRQPQDALGRACTALAYTDALGISFESVRWAWPLAARAAFELRDTAATRDLIAMLDSYQPGHVALMLRAERDLARARLADSDGGQAAASAFAAAITGLREHSTPYHLAHGLLDHADTSPARATPRPPPWPSRKPAPSVTACAAGRCSTAPTRWRTRGPGYGPRPVASYVKHLSFCGHGDGDRCRHEPARHLVERIVRPVRLVVEQHHLPGGGPLSQAHRVVGGGVAERGLGR